MRAWQSGCAHGLFDFDDHLGRRVSEPPSGYHALSPEEIGEVLAGAE
jgi:hypothetical protein